MPTTGPITTESHVPETVRNRLAGKLRSVIAETEVRISEPPDFEDVSQMVFARVVEDASRALHRIADGSYGWCEDCGAAIAIERLEALPHILTCTVCASRPSDRP